MEQEYQDITRPREVREEVKKLRKKFLRYQEAEVVYSISHRKLIELADRAGALYRMEGTVLINRYRLIHWGFFDLATAYQSVHVNC